MMSNYENAYTLLLLILACSTCYLLLREWVKKARLSPFIPSWAIVEIAVTKSLVPANGLGRRLLSSLRCWDGRIFGVTRQHAVLCDVHEVDKFLTKSSHVIDAHAIAISILHKVFGAPKETLLLPGYEATSSALALLIEKEFVNEHSAIQAIERLDLPQRVLHLISFDSDVANQAPWERAGHARLLQPQGLANGPVVEVSLLELVRNFGTSSMANLFYGHGLLDRNPGLVEDFWGFDAIYPQLVLGLPTWFPSKAFQNGLASRQRLVEALADLYKRADQQSKAVSSDDGAALTDINPAIYKRNAAYQEGGFTFAQRGQLEIGHFWGMHANSHPLLFWLILRIYSTPDLVVSLRNEMTGAMRVEPMSGSKQARIGALDLAALYTEAPLLKSCTLETLRLYNDPTSVRRLKQSTKLPGSTSAREVLPAGTWLSVPHSIMQQDPTRFTSPTTFMPERFITRDIKTGKVLARSSNMKPWGAGTAMCKGRTFAEKQIMTTAACIVALWEIEPVETMEDGAWKLPGQRPGTGVIKPTEDVRVRIRRRCI